MCIPHCRTSPSPFLVRLTCCREKVRVTGVSPVADCQRVFESPSSARRASYSPTVQLSSTPGAFWSSNRVGGSPPQVEFADRLKCRVTSKLRGAEEFALQLPTSSSASTAGTTVTFMMDEQTVVFRLRKFMTYSYLYAPQRCNHNHEEVCGRI